MIQEQPPSLLVRISSVAFFVMLTLGAFIWFVISTTQLISKFRLESQVISFYKGSMYMLGCGLGLLLLTIGGIFQGIFKLELTTKQSSLLSRGIIVSLLLMILFPQLAHYIVDRNVQKQSYSICDDVSYRWLFYTKLYYTKSKDVCNELAKKKE